MGARRNILIREEAERVKNALGALPFREQRCMTAVAKRILLDGPYRWKGDLINPVAKSLGAGVWAITHEPEQG
jgi:hypothetical protein